MDRHQETLKSWNKVAMLYQEKFMDLDLYDDTYDVFCSLLSGPAPAILEIGCGPGNITRYLLSKIPGGSITAIDMAPNMIQLAAQNNPAAHCMVMDCRDIRQLNQQFDAVISGFCMPYLSKEECAQLVQDSAFLLHDQGSIYLSMIEGDYEKSGYQTSSNGETTTFVYYHQEDYVTEMLQEHQFEIVDVLRKNYMPANGGPSVHLIFIARKSGQASRS